MTFGEGKFARPANLSNNTDQEIATAISIVGKPPIPIILLLSKDEEILMTHHEKLFSGSCHCGSVHFQISKAPKWLTDCNCSLCRRLSPLWAHIDIDSVTISAAENATIAYVHGDKTLAVHSCRICGSTTHWENLVDKKSGQMAVNFRMCATFDIEKFQIRKFDGADTWTFLD